MTLYQKTLYQTVSNWWNRIQNYTNWYTILCLYLGLRKPAQTIITRSGLRVHMRTLTDLQAIEEVFILKNYDQPPFQVPRENATIIDAGAHIGTFTLYATKGRNLQIYSLEPYPENFRTLLLNINNNNLGENVIHPYEMAVDEKDRTRRLFIDETNTGGHSFYKARARFFYKQAKSIAVRCTTLRKLLDSNQIVQCDFLKMDVEGAEYGILLNTEDEILRRFRTICVECHESEKMEHIASHLRNLGFIVTTRKSQENDMGILRATQEHIL